MVQNVGTIVGLIGKTFSMAESGLNVGIVCYKAAKKQPLSTQEKVQVTADIVFCALQIFDIGFSSARLAAPNKVQDLSNKIGLDSKKIGTGLTVAAGTGHVIRTVTAKVMKERLGVLDIAEIVGVIVYRVGDISSSCRQLEPMQEYQEIFDYIERGTTIVGTTITVVKTSTEGYKATKAYLKWLAEKDAQNESKQEKDDKKPPMQKLNVFRSSEHPNLIDEKTRKEMLSVINWKNLKSIPTFLHSSRTALSMFTCDITGKPLLFPCTPNIDMEDPPIYEQGVINELLNKTPKEVPNKWPKNLPFEAKHIKPDNTTRKHIIITLEKIAEEYKIFLDNEEK